MRHILFGSEGTPQHYLTGAGVLYTVENRVAGSVQDGQPGPVLTLAGRTVAWFDGSFVWDTSGVLAFVKGAVPLENLKLPRTTPLRAKLSPTPTPLRPLLVRLEPPPVRWVWSDASLAEVLQTGQVA